MVCLIFVFDFTFCMQIPTFFYRYLNEFLFFSHIEQEPTLSDSTADDEGDVAMTWETEAVPLAKGNFKIECDIVCDAGCLNFMKIGLKL